MQRGAHRTYFRRRQTLQNLLVRREKLQFYHGCSAGRVACKLMADMTAFIKSSGTSERDWLDAEPRSNPTSPEPVLLDNSGTEIIHVCTIGTHARYSGGRRYHNFSEVGVPYRHLQLEE